MRKQRAAAAHSSAPSAPPSSAQPVVHLHLPLPPPALARLSRLSVCLCQSLSQPWPCAHSTQQPGGPSNPIHRPGVVVRHRRQQLGARSLPPLFLSLLHPHLSSSQQEACWPPPLALGPLLTITTSYQPAFAFALGPPPRRRLRRAPRHSLDAGAIQFDSTSAAAASTRSAIVTQASVRKALLHHRQSSFRRDYLPPHPFYRCPGSYHVPGFFVTSGTGTDPRPPPSTDYCYGGGRAFACNSPLALVIIIHWASAPLCCARQRDINATSDFSRDRTFSTSASSASYAQGEGQRP